MADNIDFKLLYDEILRHSRQIFTVPSGSEVQSYNFNPQTKALLMDEIGRFRVWAEHVGAHRSKHFRASLHYRLREASHIRSIVYALLCDLRDLFQEAHDLIQRDPAAESPDVSADSDTESASPQLPLLDDSSVPLTDLDYVCADISHNVTALYRLSMLIQNPASRDKIHKFAEIDVSHFKVFETMRIRDKFCSITPREETENKAEHSPEFKIPEFLVSRLVQANLRRRQQFLYLQNHNRKIVGENRESQITTVKAEMTGAGPSHAPVLVDDRLDTRSVHDDVPQVPEATLTAVARSVIMSDTTATTAVDPSTVTRGTDFNQRFLNVRREEEPDAQSDITSIFSTASQQGQHPAYQLPPPPKKYAGFSGTPKYFHCPYCFDVICPSRSRRWRKHILRDLQPYVCTFERCSEAARIFARQNDWWDHENQCHRREWVCIICSCDNRRSSRLSFYDHVKEKHSDAFPISETRDNELMLLSRQCEIVALSKQVCPFCSAVLEPHILKTHLANHLIDIASFTFPRITHYECEEDQSTGQGQTNGTLGKEDRSTNQGQNNDTLDDEAVFYKLVMNELQAFETRKRGIDMFYPNGFHEVVERGIELASYIFSELNLSREAAAQASILALYDVVILLDNDSLSMPTQQDRANISILKNAVQIIARLFSFKTAGAKGGIRRLFFINSADEHEHTYITADEIQRLLYKPHLTKPKSTENVLYRNILSPLLYQRDQSQERSQERPMLIILLNFGSLAAEPSNGVSSASILSSSVTDVLSKKVGNGPASIIYQFLQIGNNEAEKRLTDQLARLPAPAGDYINTHHVGPELLYNGEQSPSEAVVSVITFLLNALSGGENTWPSQEEASLPLSRQPTNEGNIQEDINTFEDYSGLGFSVAFSSDGQLLASGSRDQTVRLWSVQRHEAINSFVGHSSVVNSVEFSPDAQLLASGSGDQTIWLWSVQRQQAIHTFQGHSNSVNSVAFSPDAQLLASGSDDRTVRLWSVQRHEVIHTFEGHSNSVNSVAFSPDGQLLASGSGDRTVRLWSVQRHEVVHTFEGHSDSVNSVAFSPDAQLLASGSGDRTVRLWSVQRHEVIHTFEGHSDSVNSVAFSPDGQLLASGSGDRTVRLWSLLRQEVAHTFEGHRDRLALAPEDQLLASGLLSVAFSPDGQLLASGDNNTIFVWQVVHGQYLGLRASTNSNRLALAKVNIQGAAGLDPLNLRLLRQHGAVGEPANT